MSALKEVLREVLQGSVLGPVLFSIFTNYLDEDKEVKYSQEVIAHMLNDKIIMQKDLGKVELWSSIAR